MKLEELRMLIHAETNEHVRKGLDYISANPKSDHIPLLVEGLVVATDALIRYEIEAMLGAMNVQGAEQALIQCMKSKSNSSVGVKLLEFMWSNGFAGEGHLEFLLQYAAQFGLLGWIEMTSILEVGESKYGLDELKASYMYINAIKIDQLDPEEKALIEDVKNNLLSFIDAN
jgi:hypothetical protein